MNDDLTFGDFLGGMRRLFPPALLSGDGLERLLAVARRLPLGAIDQPFGFEFALGAESANADFCVVPALGSALAEHYIRDGEAAPPGSPAAALGACLAGNVRDRASFPAGRGGGIILEYDVPVMLSGDPPPPGVFFAPRGVSAEAGRKLLDDPADVVAALWNVAGWPADARELREVERVYEALSGRELLFQAGVMPGRAQRAMRLVVHRIDPRELPALIERLRWPGPVDAVMSAIERTSDLTGPGAALSLDVSAHGISPRLGLELFRSAGRPRMDRTGWWPLIDRLRDCGWCVPPKAEGLRAWTRAERVIGPDGIYRVFQHINHVKVVVEDGRIVAKAYTAMVVGRPGR